MRATVRTHRRAPLPRATSAVMVRSGRVEREERTLGRTRRLTQASPAALAAGGLIAVALAGCGKPQYCEDRSQLEQSIKGIGDVQAIRSGGVDELKTRLQDVESDAKALVDSAKSDFASESDAISSSVSKLKTDIEALPSSSPSPQQVAVVAADAKAVVTAFQNFKTATKDEC